MKKELSLLILLGIVCSFLACGKPPVKPSSSDPDVTTEPEEGYYLDTLPTETGGEEIFRVMTIAGNIVREDREKKTVVSDALFSRDVQLEDRYGIRVEYRETKNNNTAAIADMRNAVLNPDDGNRFHAFVTSAERLMRIAASGLCEDLNSMPVLDMKQEWWSQSLNENCTINNTLYLSAGPYSEYFYHAAICLAYNKEIADAHEGMDIYGAVLDGTWTLDRMKTFCVDYDVTHDNGDGVWDEGDTWAIAANESLFYGMFASAGGNFSTVDENGDIQIPLSTERSQQILEKILTVFRPDNVYANKYKESAAQFTGGRALFLYTSTGYLFDYLPESKVEYGIIPLPKYELAQKSYITCAWPTSNYCVSIPRGLTESGRQFAGLMLEAYCFLSHELVRPAKYETVLLNQVALDPTASRLLDVIFKNMYFDLNLVFDFGGSRSVVQNTLRSFSMGRYVSLLSGIEGEIDQDIASLISSEIKS